MYNIQDYEKEAQSKLDKSIFDYIAGGAGSEQTLKDNEEIFSSVKIIPRG